MKTLPTTPLSTPLCDLLGIRYPIVQAGMAGGPTTPELVAAVSNAGGLGVLGAARMPLNELRAAIRAIKAQTDRPFGVNVLLAPPERNHQDVSAVQNFLNHFRQVLGIPPVAGTPPGLTDLNLPPSILFDQLQIIFEEQVPVFSVGLGDPSRFVAAVHEANCRVMAMVTTVEEAKRVVAGGADIVVAQGAEAGGHRSTFEVGPHGDVPLVGTLALVPQVVDAVSVPVLAAGGIMDGRGLVAALALGAAGAVLGTRFLTAHESGAARAYQERLLASTEADTVITCALTGRPARSVRNRFLDKYREAGPEPLAWPLQSVAAGDIYEAAHARSDADYFPLLAGQGLRMLKCGQSAADIMGDLITEASDTLMQLHR